MNQSTRLTIANIIEIALNGLLAGLVFLVPLCFLLWTNDPFFINKQFLFFGGVFVALILWATLSVVRGKVSLAVHPLLLPLALLAIASIVSVIANKSSFEIALTGRAGLVSALLLFVFIASSRPAKFAAWLMAGLVASGTLLAAATILSFSGLPGMLGLPSWMVSNTFTPAGTMSALVVAIAGALPLVALRLKTSKTTPVEQIFSIVLVIILLAGGIIGGVLIIQNKETNGARMPLSIGWQVAIETLKQRPLVGVGTGNYLSAYTRYRPITTNALSIWNQRFLQAPNELFQQFTENGILGFAALLLLAWIAIRLAFLSGFDHLDNAAPSLVLVLGSFLLFPLNAVSIVVLAALLSLVVLNIKAGGAAKARVYDASLKIVALKEGIVELERTKPMPDMLAGIQSAISAIRPASTEEKSANILSWIIAVPLIAVSGLGLFVVSRAWAADVVFKEALDGIAQNNGLVAYNKLIETLNLNPLSDTYHRQYADVNLRLANSLASQPKPSDQDRTNVSQLVQQSIREAKIAAQLNPTDVRNWEELSTIYRAVINVADGARDWTVVAYTEAIKLDPYNPLLRLDLGGVFYSAKDWENAITSFQAATNVKPDYANGYYNLALAYDADNRSQDALRAMQQTMKYIDPNSKDYAVAQQKLDELNKKVQQALKTEPKSPAAQPTGESQLSAPQPIPTAAPGANKVQLGQQEAPPPTPQASGPTPTPVVGQ